jgi:hypothetical protein
VRPAYAPTVDLQVFTKKGETLSPYQFESQHTAAMHEIHANRSLSFTFINERTGSQARDVYRLRCGERLSRSTFCLRRSGHADECSSKWETGA